MSNLFGQEAEEQEQIELSKPDRQALVSYLFKTCRLGDVQGAMLAAEHLRRWKGERYVLNKLAGLIGEDGAISDYVQVRPLISRLMDDAERKRLHDHDLWMAVAAVASARPWYADGATGRELEEAKQQCKEDSLPWPEMPSWVHDRHTAEGRRRAKQGAADLRLDGNWDNRWSVRDRFLEFEQSYRNEHPDADDDEVRRAWVKSHYDSQEEG